MPSGKLILRGALSIAVSVVFIWLSLRHVDVRAVLGYMASADPFSIAAYVLILCTVHVIRTVRWGILLEPLGHVGFRRLNAVSAVGFMLLMVMPLRLGELARPLLIARPPPDRGPQLSRSGAFASIFVERVVDGLSVGLLGVLALRTLGDQVSGQYAIFVRRAAILVSVGFLALALGLLAAFFFRTQTLALTSRLLTPLSPSIARRATGMLDAFIGALHLGSGWRALLFFALTVLYWGCGAWGLGVLGHGFGFHGLTPLRLATLLAVQVVGVMVPAGPGMVGTFQFFTQAGLSLFVAGALKDPRAAAYANMVWFLQFAVQVSIGLIFLVQGHISLRGLFSFGGAPAEPALEPPAGSSERRAASP